MRITLSNFRCHSNRQFELPDSGLVLLSGSSGSGKTTLLKAILYALFGSKAIRKPYTFGVATCSVTLEEFKGMKVHRTNRPNRVVVNDNLEDAAAQAYIDERLGMSYDEFLISSYIPQKNNSSVLSLAQSEQLHMIKTLAFEGEQNELHKGKLKEMIRESSNNLVKKHTETQFSQREVDRIQTSVVPVEFPLTVRKGDTIDKTIDDYHTRVRSYSKRMATLLERKAEFNEELQNHVHAQAELEMTNDKLSDVNNQLARIDARHHQLKVVLQDLPEDLETRMETTELEIQYLELVKERTALQTQYSQIKTDEAEERATQKAQLERELWKNRSSENANAKLQNYQQKLQLWEQFLKATNELGNLQRELEYAESSQDEMIGDYQQLVEHIKEEKAELYLQKERLAIAAEKLALEKEIMHCPECDAPLRWQNKNLVSVHDHAPVEEREYKVEIELLEKRISDLDKTTAGHERVLRRVHAIHFPVLRKIDPQLYKQMKQKVQMLTTFIAQNEQREKELFRIARESAGNYVTPALKSIKQQLDTKKNEQDDIYQILDTMPTKDITTLSEQLRDLSKQIVHYQEHTEELQELDAELEQLRRKFKHHNSRIHSLEKKMAGIDAAALKNKITGFERDIAKAKKKQTRDEEVGEHLDQFLAYRDQQQELDRWEDKLVDAGKQLKTAEKIHTAHLTLRDKYVQAEILALESTISSINEHTRYYLDTFFADHQLSAVLEATHKGKKIQTLKISTAINYKGNEYDNISQMSGGEFDRCTLSSICGINSMLGSPILVLDESLASLDTDTNTEIIRFLSELAQDKLILVCSHEAVRGIFDEIVEL